MSDAVPAWAYEKAEVLPHDPQLADRALAERDQLAKLLAPWLVGGVEHVGSTAVPGLAAKPVIDLMASVTDPDVVVVQAGGTARRGRLVLRAAGSGPGRGLAAVLRQAGRLRPAAGSAPARDPGRPPAVGGADRVPGRAAPR